MPSLTRIGTPGRTLGPLTAALAAAAAASWAATGPVLAQPATGETLAQHVLDTCSGLTWAELIEGTGPHIVACRDAADDAVIGTFTLAVDDQERVGTALAVLMRSPVEAGAPRAYPALAYLMASRFQNLLFLYCPPGGTPAIVPTLETCTATVRIVGVAAQAQTAEIVPIHIQDICSKIGYSPAWRADIVAVMDGLAARAATGTDPVMQGRIDVLQAGVAACP